MNRLREYRRSALLTQAELAKLARLSPTTVYNIEAGCQCRLRTKRRLIQALGVGIGQLDTVFPAN